MIKAIIFDFGSVLYKTNWEKIDEEFIKKYGFSIRIRDIKGHKELMELYANSETGKNSLREFFLEIKREINIEEVLDFYKKSYSKNRRINKELIEIIEQLKNNYTLFGFTDTNKEHFEANQKENFFNNFKKVFTSFELGIRKSEETAFKKILKDIEFKPNECLFIDDHLQNTENAKRNGFNVLHYYQFPDIKPITEEFTKLDIKY